METATATRPLVITRTFNAPRELVWRAWTEPQAWQKWWGPKDFTCPLSKMDLRPGGKYFTGMKSPEGQEFWSTGVYKEINPVSRLVMTDSFADEDGNVVPASHYGMADDFPLECIITVELEAVDNGKTRMTLTHEGVPSGNIFEMTMTAWNESFDKLAERAVK